MIVKPNPNGTDSSKLYTAANYPSSGIYVGQPQDWVILVSKKENICSAIKQSILEETVEVSISDNSTSSTGFNINDVLKLIAVKNDSANIKDLIK